jgi:flagellar biogenesis protein FliO
MIRIDFDRERIKRNLHQRGGLAAWLISRLQKGAEAREQRKSRLALVERISIAPRQSLALVEAEGRRFLIGTSQDGGPVFYALDETSGPVNSTAPSTRSAKTRAVKNAAGSSARVSW